MKTKITLQIFPSCVITGYFTTDACSGRMAIFGPTCKSCQRIHGAFNTSTGPGIIWSIVVSHEWRFSAKIVDHDYQSCQSGG